MSEGFADMKDCIYFFTGNNTGKMAVDRNFSDRGNFSDMVHMCFHQAIFKSRLISFRSDAEISVLLMLYKASKICFPPAFNVL